MNPFGWWINSNSEKQGSGSGFHSASYHRHFEGYTETRGTGSDGKRKIVRVYTGAYYAQALSDKRRKQNRLLFAALYLGAAALFVLCASARIPSNAAWYLAVAQALSFFSLFWMLYVLIQYLTAPAKMEVGHYRATSGPIMKSSRTAAVTLGLLALMTLGNALLLPGQGLLSGFLCATGYACSATAVFMVGRIESRIAYNRTRSEHETMGDGVEIER
jgi:hypothetical protein